jgi:hypothetical protein
MMCRLFSIVLYVVAGFFFYLVCLLGFASAPSSFAKAGIMFMFTLPAIVALCSGLALNRFLNWTRDVGIILLCATGFTTFLIFSFICFLQTDEFRKMMKPETLAFFSGYITGSLCIIGLAGLGVIFLRMRRPCAEQDTSPNAGSADASANIGELNR